jgi:hypothetical protein
MGYRRTRPTRAAQLPPVFQMLNVPNTRAFECVCSFACGTGQIEIRQSYGDYFLAISQHAKRVRPCKKLSVVLPMHGMQDNVISYIILLRRRWIFIGIPFFIYHITHLFFYAYRTLCSRYTYFPVYYHNTQLHQRVQRSGNNGAKARL